MRSRTFLSVARAAADEKARHDMPAKKVAQQPTDTENIAAVKRYLDVINRKRRTGVAREHTYRGALETLLGNLIPNAISVNEAAQIDCGAPDITLIDRQSGLVIGYVEAKDVGTGDLLGRRASGNKEQFNRYKAALDNIAFTDYIEFVFYRRGEPEVSVRIAEIDGDGIRPLPENYGRFLSLIERLGNVVPQCIASPTQLARFMAAKARMLQVAAQRFLSDGKAGGSSLSDLMEGFRRVLMPDVSIEEFSDIYAQTLTYGMFAARLHDATPEDFSREEAAKLIPKSNPFLRKLFNHINNGIEKEIEWAVDDIVRLFAAADVKGIMKGYGKSHKRSDPMIHFYEEFLSAYDAGLRKDRGVWYTPLPVVRFIVRAVDELLVRDFGLPEGMASRDKVSIEVEDNTESGKRMTKKVKKEVPKVQILDPAMGTSTFLAECVMRIHDRFVGNEGMWPGFVTDHLIPRLNGFELLMAPYTMAHIKMDMVLDSTGWKGTGNERFNLFLTDSLMPPPPPGGTLFDLILGDEAREANKIKRDWPVMVVLGNPPYKGISKNKGEWIEGLIEDYKKEPGGKEKLKERKNWLGNDYVKFIRLAQYYVEKNPDGGRGIVAYITPHGFLDDPTSRGMRWNLLKTFDEIYILNLHGSLDEKFRCPDGSKDANVFNITQGVCINIFMRTGRKQSNTLGKVFYADLWGDLKDKFAFLESTAFADVDYKEVCPTAPMYFFIPKNTEGEAEYNKGFRLDELMSVNKTAVLTMGDSFAVAQTKGELIERIDDINGKRYSESEIAAKYGLGKNYPSFILRNLPIVPGEDIVRYAYRPFDNRQICFTSKTVWRPRMEVMRHIHKHENQALVVCRQSATEDWNLVHIADSIVDDSFVSNRTKERGYVFPLWLYEEHMGCTEKIPNLNPEIVSKFSTVVGKVTPQSIFDYIYAVLHSPAYRVKYREFLKIALPRIPYPVSVEWFNALSKIGSELRKTHLLKFTPTKDERTTIATFPMVGNNEVGNLSFMSGRVTINDVQYFDHVPMVAWSMAIGGYRPAQQWLKDRKGRVLTSDECQYYRMIIYALLRTRRLMDELSLVWEK